MLSGGNGPRDTPVPIPNTKVKPGHADGTSLEAEWKSKSPPVYMLGCIFVQGDIFEAKSVSQLNKCDTNVSPSNVPW